MDWIKRISNSILISLLLLLLLAVPVFAISNPNSISLNTSKVFQNIFVNGDVLFIGEHNVDYATSPNESADEAFQFQMKSADDTTIIRTKGITDYQWSLTSHYFTPSQVTSSNITWGSLYVTRIIGDPILFPVPVEGTTQATKTLTSTDWNIDGSITSKELLRLYLLQVARRIENDSGQTLLFSDYNGNKVLNSTGRAIFLAALPNIDTVIPTLFQTFASNPNFNSVSINSTFEDATVLSSNMGTKIENAFEGIGNFFGISKEMAAGSWLMLFALTIASIVFLNTGNTTGAIILTIPIIVTGAFLGAIPIAFLFTFGFLAVTYAAYFFWLRGT